MVTDLGTTSGWRILDVAAGTGSITRALRQRGASVISLDQSPPMLDEAVRRGAVGVIATGENLPFEDDSFDAVTFGYLLRYVESVPGALAELARVVRPGGRIGMVEFGRPRGLWRPLWWIYTRAVLPAAGRLISPSWHSVGAFLGPSIDAFADSWPPDRMRTAWERAGMIDVDIAPMSLGGGLVATATVK
jgi:demethylmenaquinone methyltransferase/2-methoxy-6-polyprenyl-1,4-benzoquinol methylase